MPRYLDIFSDLGIDRDYLTEEPEAIPTGADRWEITKGVISGVDQLQAIGGGLVSMVGDVVGVDSLRDWGIETYKRNIEEAKVNEARIGRYEDIENIGDAFDYVMHGIGSALPMFVPSMVSGGVGAIAARKAAEAGVKKFLSERVSKSVATGLTEKAAAKLAAQQGSKYAAYGLGAGVGVGSVGLETGSIFGKIQAETGEFRSGVAVSHGAIAGVLDALPIGRVLNRLGVGQQAKQQIAGEIQDGATSYIGKQILAEAGTEGIQTIIERHAVKWVDNNKAVFTPEGWSEIINATLLGGVAGGALAAPISLTRKQERSKQIFEEIESDVTDIGQSKTADEAIIKGSNIIDSETDSLAQREIELEEIEPVKPVEPIVEKPFKESIEEFTLLEKNREAVKKALDEGRPVPEEILKKYPDLVAPAEPVTPKIEPEKLVTPELEPATPKIEPIAKEVLPPTEKPIAPKKEIITEQKIPEGFKTTGDKFEVGQRAIKLKDGTVVFDDSPLHALQINKLKAAGIDISEIESGGFIRKDGSYIKGSQDAPGIIAKEMAQKKAELAKEAGVFIDKDIEVKEKKQQLSDIYNVKVTSKEVGSLTSTTDTIHDEQDLADLVMDVSQKAQELFLAVVTDSKGKILRVIKHTSGLKASSSVDPTTVAAEVASINNAKFVHFAHNHPGGALEPSISDIETTKDLVGWLDGTGIEFGNHVITSPGGKAINFNIYGNNTLPVPVIEGVSPPKGKAIKIPYTERFIDEGSVKGKAITNPGEGLKVVKSIQSDNAILLLSNAHEPAGVVFFDGVDMRQLRQKGGVNRILKAINATNASAAIVKTESNEAAVNVINFLNRSGGVRVLDWMHKDSKGILISASSAGDPTVKTKGPFFSQSLTGETKTTYTKQSTEKAIATPISKINKTLGIKIKVIGFNEIPPLVKKDVIAGKRPKAYTEGNNIFLIHDSIENDKDSLVTLAHELKGHVGANGIIGKDNWNKVIPLYRELKKIGGDRFNTIKTELDKRYGDLNEESELKEFIAIAAEHREKEGSVGKFMRKVREFFNAGLRAIGISKPIGMSDIDVILTRSEQFLKYGVAPLPEITVKEPDITKEGIPKKIKPTVSFSLKDQGYSDDAIEAVNIGGFGRKTKKEGFIDRFNKMKENGVTKFRQTVVDQFASFRSNMKDERTWMLSHLTASAPGALEATINLGRPYLHKDGVIAVDTSKKSLNDILKPLGDNLDKWTHWIAGHRADRLMKQGKEHLFPQRYIDALKTLNKGNEKLFNDVRKEFELMNNAVTKIAVDTGLVNADEAKQWKEEGFYLPFYRVLEEGESRGPRAIGNSGLVRQTAYKKLKGGVQQLDDLMVNSLSNWNHLISASLKNQAARSALKTAVQLKIAQRVPKSQKSKNAVYVRENGKEIWYEVDDPLVLDSLMSLNWQGLDGMVMKASRAFKRALTIGVTASPEFKVRNLIRDSVHAMAVTDISVKLHKNLYEGWKATAKTSDISAQMLASGGSFGQSGYIHGSDPEAIKSLIKKGQTEKNIKESILDTPAKLKKIWDAYQDFGARLENINRAADYSQAVDRDVDRLTAAFKSRDHLDFTRTGSSTAVRAIAQIVPFLNARLQGLDKMARSAPKTTKAWLDPREATQFKAVIGIYSAMSVALYLAMKDDDDYKEAEEWEKRTYHLFKIPGSEIMYRIPRPFEVGAVAYMAESIAQQMVDDKVHGKLFAERLGHTIHDTFSFDPIPQIFKPGFEVAMNKNLFTGRDIESMSMERLSPSRRKNAWTSETAIAMSEGMDKITWGKVVLSPVQIQHLVRGYLGWLGATGLASADILITRPFTDAPAPPKMRITEYPLVKAFARTGPARNTKYTTEFYNRLKEINRAFADIQDARKMGDLEEEQRLVDKNRDKLVKRKFYNKQSKNLSNINKRMKQIRMSNIDPLEKRTELDRLTVMKNFITKMVSEREEQKN
jgi:DNA repair protein RadC